MAKNKKPQTNSGNKARTKYEIKMEERKKQEEKDKRDAKMLRIGSIAICAVIIAAIVISIAASIMNKKAATKDAYVTIGNHSVTKLEYDYYYSLLKSNYMTNYASILSYMGVDASQDLDNQQYTEEMTYKDYFDQLTVDQLKQTKALADDAKANQFSYDDAEDYANILSGIEAGAKAAGVSESNYYTSMYGKYATKKNIEPFIREGLLAEEYYNYLIEQNTPGEQEIKDYYAENVQNFDRVDYHSFSFPANAGADASEEDLNKAMEDAKNKADAMMEARKEGTGFKELCHENASEENKAVYENEETNPSLREGAYYSSTPQSISGWLYEDGRKEGDIAVLEDADNNQYYVVEFVKRYYDEADDENISNMISSEKVSEYIQGKMENYTVTDLKGELKYLILEDAAAQE